MNISPFYSYFTTILPYNFSVK